MDWNPADRGCLTHLCRGPLRLAACDANVAAIRAARSAKEIIMPCRQTFWSIALIAPIAACLSPAATAAPNVSNVSPRGLQIGQPTTLVFSGSDLPGDAQLIIDAKIDSQSIKPGAKPDKVEIEVTLDPSTPPGIYPARLAGAGGISGPVAVGVDHLPQL